MAMQIQLEGGLGNQLFIWAMAHSVVQETQKPVELVYFKDKSTREDRPIEIIDLTSYCKHAISISRGSWSAHVLRAVDKIATIKGLQRFDFQHFLGIRTMKESFDLPATLKGTKLLRGYFQNIQMVSQSQEIVYDELQSHLKSFEEPENPERRKRELVIHIRRGDSTHISKEWGILDFNYYQKIVGNEKDATILTDDISFFSEIKTFFPAAEILSPRECNSWQALKLMTNAKHLVMANSTLSWWSGWLMSQESGKCTFPYPWRPGNIKLTEQLIFNGATLTSSQFTDE